MDETQILDLFIGPRAAYYKKSWSQVGYTSRSNTWNWSAFFASLLWLAYRRMYVYCAVFTFFALLALYIGLVFNMGEGYKVALTLFVPVILGMFGNRIYRYFAEQSCFEIYGLNLPDSEIIPLIKVRGGTNTLAVICAIFIISFLFYGMFLLFNLVPQQFTFINLLKILVPV